jgi:hypothetical protein
VLATLMNTSDEEVVIDYGAGSRRWLACEMRERMVKVTMEI